MKRLIYLLILIILASTSVCLYCVIKRHTNPFDRDALQARADYETLSSMVVSSNVHQFLRPVHIAKSNFWVGSGTLILNSTNGFPWKIATASHLFHKNFGVAVHSYHLLKPDDRLTDGYIREVKLGEVKDHRNSSIDVDIALCPVGEAELSGGNSSISLTWGDNFQKTVAFYPTALDPVVSLVTGKTVRVLGEMQEKDGQTYFVLACDSVPGQSGEGFWDSKNSYLYIVSGGFVVKPFMRKSLEVTESTKMLTLASAIKIVF